MTSFSIQYGRQFFCFRFERLRFNLFNSITCCHVVFFFLSCRCLSCFFFLACILSGSWKQSINLFLVPSCQSDTVRAHRKECCFVAKHRMLAFQIVFARANGFEFTTNCETKFKKKTYFIYIQLLSISLNCCDACASVIHPVPYVRFYFTDFWLSFKLSDTNTMSMCISSHTFTIQ